jgi:hypothetical protein
MTWRLAGGGAIPPATAARSLSSVDRPSGVDATEIVTGQFSRACVAVTGASGVTLRGQESHVHVRR